MAIVIIKRPGAILVLYRNHWKVRRTILPGRQDGFDFALLERIFSPTAIIVILSRDGLLLAANRATLVSIEAGQEIVGLHGDDAFPGFDFGAMIRATCHAVLETGAPELLDRIYPHPIDVLVRVRQFVARTDFGGEPAMLSIAIPVPDPMVDQFRQFDPQRKEFPLTIGSDIKLTLIEMETLYWLQKIGSVAGIATIIDLSERAVRKRIEALREKVEAIATHQGFDATDVPISVASLKSLTMHWRIDDAIFAGCINAVNKYYGRSVIKIRGFNASLEESLITRLHDIKARSARETFAAALAAVSE